MRSLWSLGGPPGPLSLAYSLRPNTLEPDCSLAKVSRINPAHKAHKADARGTRIGFNTALFFYRQPHLLWACSLVP